MKGKNFSPISKDPPRKDLFHQESLNRNTLPSKSPEFGNNSEKSTSKESFRKYSAPFNSRMDRKIQRNHPQTQFPTNSIAEKESSIFQRELELNHSSNKQSTQHNFSPQNLASHNLQYRITNKIPGASRELNQDNTSQHEQSRKQVYHNGYNLRNLQTSKRGYYQQKPMQQQFYNNPTNRIPIVEGSPNNISYHNNGRDDNSYRNLSNLQNLSATTSTDKEFNHHQSSYNESIYQHSDRNKDIQPNSNFTKFSDQNSSYLISEPVYQENKSAFRKYSPSQSKIDSSDSESSSQHYPFINTPSYRSPNKFTMGKNYPATSSDYSNKYNQQEDLGQRYSVAKEENKVNSMLDHLDLQSGRDSPKSTKSSSNIFRSKSMTMLKSPYQQGNSQQRIRSQSSAFNRPSNNKFDNGPQFNRQVQYF